MLGGGPKSCESKDPEGSMPTSSLRSDLKTETKELWSWRSVELFNDEAFDKDDVELEIIITSA